MKKNDLRIDRTQKMIKDSFVQLIAEMGYENISITDISKRAMINRKTFYAHYESKQRLYQELIIQLIGSLDMNLKSDTKRSVKNIDFEALNQEVRRLLTSLVRRRDVVCILFNDPTSDYFEKQLEYILTRNFFSFFSHSANASMPLNVPSSVIMESIMTYLMVWIRWAVTQEALDMEEISALISRLVAGTMFELMHVE